MSAVPADRDHPGDAERDADLDAAFADIIARWDDDTAGPVPAWPASEDLEPTTDPDGDGAPDERSLLDGAAEPDEPPRPTSMDQIRIMRDSPLPAPEPVEPSPGPRDWELAGVPDDHYEPPEPPPIPRGDLAGQLAWAGLLLGPAFLLFAGLFWRDVGRMWLAIAAAAFVGGFVALVVRLPHSRGEDDDDGAVV